MKKMKHGILSTPREEKNYIIVRKIETTGDYHITYTKKYKYILSFMDPRVMYMNMIM